MKNIAVSAYREILVVRSAGTWTELPHLGEIHADGSHRAEHHPGGWAVVTVTHTSPERHWIPALAEATGSPVLWCTITTMDSTYIRGLSRAGAWEGWLNTGGVEEEVAATRIEQLDLDELLEEGGQEAYEETILRLGDEAVNEIVAAAPALAEAMRRWAREAGHDPDAEAIESLIIEGDASGSRHVDELLTLLGVKNAAPARGTAVNPLRP